MSTPFRSNRCMWCISRGLLLFLFVVMQLWSVSQWVEVMLWAETIKVMFLFSWFCRPRFLLMPNIATYTISRKKDKSTVSRYQEVPQQELQEVQAWIKTAMLQNSAWELCLKKYVELAVLNPSKVESLWRRKDGKSCFCQFVRISRPQQTFRRYQSFCSVSPHESFILVCFLWPSYKGQIKKCSWELSLLVLLHSYLFSVSVSFCACVSLCLSLYPSLSLSLSWKSD